MSETPFVTHSGGDRANQCTGCVVGYIHCSDTINNNKGYHSKCDDACAYMSPDILNNAVWTAKTESKPILAKIGLKKAGLSSGIVTPELRYQHMNNQLS